MVIAVIDSGIDANHPDLADDIIFQYCSNTTSGGCPAGRYLAPDTSGHGTLVTGVITANGTMTHDGSPTGTPIIGVAPDTKIVSIRYTENDNSGDSIDVANALSFILDNINSNNNLSIDAVNISLNLSTHPISSHCDNDDTLSFSLRSYIHLVHATGVKIFAASGNDYWTTGVGFPACHSEVIAVGASTDGNIVTDFSNIGAPLDYVAPGEANTITTSATNSQTVPYSTEHPCYTQISNILDTGLCTVGGTSMASPHLAAVGILAEEAGGYLSDVGTPPTLPQLRQILNQGSTLAQDPETNLMFFRPNALYTIQGVLRDAQAGPPSNDSLANARPLTTLSSLSVDIKQIQDPYLSTLGPEDIPLPARCGGSSFTNTVWYTYQYYGSGVYPLSFSTEGSTYDTIIAIYDLLPENSQTFVACNDDISTTNKQSAINYSSYVNHLYMIMVANKGNIPLSQSEGLHLHISYSDAGDTIVVFNQATSRITMVSSLRPYPEPFDYSNYLAGSPSVPSSNRRWVMGDWDGDGKKTPGFYGANGVFYTTNIYGTVDERGRAVWQGTWFGMNSGYVGNFAVAGRFDPSVPNDCVGVIDSGNFPPYGVAFALYYTCDFSEPNPNKTFQWLSVLLPDSQGFTGAFQFTTGDFGTDGNAQPNFVPDGIDTIAVRRSQFVAFTNTPPTTINATYPYAQYLDFANTGTGNPYGSFVAGDWDSNQLDSFGIVFHSTSGSIFYRRNDLEWNSWQYRIQTLNIEGPSDPYLAASWRETSWIEP